MSDPASAVTIKDLYKAELFDTLVKTTKNPQCSLELLAAVSASPRFRDVPIIGFEDELDNESLKQFSAASYRLTEHMTYIAFRGTDNSVAGWMEDMLMSLSEPVPAQLRAANYVNRIASLVPGDLILGGHSKGGNLAVYGGAMCSARTQTRIRAVYSHDGPGFLPTDLEQNGFAVIRDRIHKTLPQSSVFGLLFEQECDYEIIRSNAVSGVLQHDPFSWEVSGDRLVRRQKLSLEGERVYRKINNWASGINEEDRERFIRVIVTVLDDMGITDFTEIAGNLKQYIPEMIKRLHGMEGDMKKFFFHTLYLLAATDPKDIQEHPWEEFEEELLEEDAVDPEKTVPGISKEDKK